MLFSKITHTHKLTVLFLILFSTCSFAQNELTHDSYWIERENNNAIIGVKNCYIRNAPSINAKLLDSLQMGKEVLILKSTENKLKIKGINVSWIQIQYTNKSGETQTGFLWKGFLALGFQKNKQNTFLTTIDKIETITKNNFEQEMFSISAKILDQDNNLLYQKTIQKNITDSYYFEDKTIGGLGLKNISEIYRISFSGQACGIPSLYYYFGWDNKKFLELPEKYSVGDAGIYYYYENFIFPKESGGKPDLIIKKVKQAEGNNESKEYYSFNVSEWSETYKWNGEKASFISKSKIKKYIEKD
ncbi:SH3 domain-containing protein [Flavobacterium seoulense]|uniref:SH3b domain-containing protein n=1 Tax=Flavobacterium seoulense TaxID=1492738 RepID=A0A066WM55_9FLAO|nr:SH3 domain-containing protein [Flavobacterium seoulense]KDN53678.1 hypothetical protein FEM21_32100 [Flavobacterium seoulense]